MSDDGVLALAVRRIFHSQKYNNIIIYNIIIITVAVVAVVF